MRQKEETTYFILDGLQGGTPDSGWRAQFTTNLRIAREGLMLGKQPGPPIPLKDEKGTLGGLENPTGVAVGPDNAIYISDSENHVIFKIVRREGVRARALFFRASGGQFASDHFVYVPTMNRVERWPGAEVRPPQNFSEVEVICETVWDETRAREIVAAFLRGEDPSAFPEHCRETEEKPCCGGRDRKPAKRCGCDGAKGGCKCGESSAASNCGCGKAKGATEEASIEKEWRDFYPANLPAGEICLPSLECLPCLGGKGHEPRRFSEPRGLSISRSGNLYVADTNNHRVQVFGLRGLALKAVWGKRAKAADVVSPEPVEDCVPVFEHAIGIGQPVAGDLPGEFNHPWDVVVDGRGDIYVADKGNHRIQKFNHHTRQFTVIDGTQLAAHFFRALYGPSARDRFVFIPARSRLERWPDSLGHDPSDMSEVIIVSEDVTSTKQARQVLLELIGAKGTTDILAEWDAAYPGALADFPQPEAAFSSPAHLAVDARDRVYVVDEDNHYVKVLDSSGRVINSLTVKEDVTGDFKPTAIVIDSEGKLLLAGDDGIHRFNTEAERLYYADHYTSWNGSCAGLAIDVEGKLLTVGSPVGGIAEIPPPSQFIKSGSFISLPLDSKIESCQWHKLLVNYSQQLPTGTSVTLWTHTSESELTPVEIQSLKDEDWQTGQSNADDLLIQSGPGRFLWLKIEFKGNGIETPVVARLKAYFPRVTCLQYLPAIYQADPVSKDFLERFLSIFEATFSSLEAKVAAFSDYLDPAGVPASGEAKDFLAWLAGWVDMAFDASWSIETRRLLLKNSTQLYRKRGTAAGLKKLLSLALGIEVQILEHFQLRRWLFLTGEAGLGGGFTLGGGCSVNRLRLDDYSRIGDFALISTGDPSREPFFAHAHQFSVFVQSALIRDELIERMMRYLIDKEKPAHTDYRLVKVEPRFRIGMQSTVGFDTQLGVYPRLILNQTATLGYDALLSCESEGRGPAAMQVGDRSRVGVNAMVG